MTDNAINIIDADNLQGLLILTAEDDAIDTLPEDATIAYLRIWRILGKEQQATGEFFLMKMHKDGSMHRVEGDEETKDLDHKLVLGMTDFMKERTEKLLMSALVEAANETNLKGGH